ncbi:MAG: response regulator [Desulfovibrionaceae bacterium]
MHQRDARLGIFNTLQTRLSLLIVMVSAFFILLFSIYDYTDTRRHKLADLDVLADNVSTRLSRTMRLPLWNVDSQSVIAIIETEMADKKIAAIAVFDEDNTLFAGRQRSADWSVLVPFQGGTETSRDVRMASIEMGSEHIGRVYSSVSTRFVEEELRVNLIVSCLRTLLLEVLLVVTLFLFLRRLIIHPLASLTHTARAVSDSENYALRAPKGPPGELGFLVDSFNAMLATTEDRDRQLKEHSEKLESLVAARTGALDEALRTAESASRAKGEFLANMSHEIRTPMNAVIGMADIALSMPLEPKLREYLSVIRTSARSLLGLLNDILDFSKIEADHLTLESVPFNPRDVLDQIADLFRNQVSEKGIELVLDLDPDVPACLRGDPLRLRQVLVNLITNAFKFTERGEVYLGVGLVCLRDEAADLRFTVRDSGIGMPPELLEHIFDAFIQADTSTTRRYGGSGLGLAITHKLVELMDGRIAVQSTPGKGATFTVEISLPTQALEPEAASGLPEQLAGIRCLVVDDSVTNRFVMRKILESFGIESDGAASGEEAVARLGEQGERFDLILLDWRLPGLDGLECYARLSAMGHAPRTIMMTAFGREAQLQRAMDLGITTFLIKPIKAANLRAAILEVYGLQAESPSQVENGPFLQGFFTGRRALLAEDNEINRRVGVEMLESAGFAVDVACDGGQAVQAVLHARYDVVFMDVQMPVMDGFEATRRIRAVPALAGVPIIAMTAHAMTGDREKCLEAGMDGYLTKPVDRDTFFQMLRRWVTPGKPTEPADPNDMENLALAEAWKPSQHDQQPSLPETMPGIDVAHAVRRLGGKTALLRKVMLRFADNFAHAADDVRAMIQANDLEGAGTVTHNLKAAAGNIAAEDLARTAAYVDQRIRAGETGQALFALDALAQALRVVIRSIHRLGASNGNERAAPADEAATALAAAGIDLASALERLGGKRALLDNLLALFAQNFAASAAPLRRAIEDNDLAHARRLVHTMAGAAGNVGANALHQLARNVETHLQANDVNAATAALPLLFSALDTVCAGIRSATQDPPPPSP